MILILSMLAGGCAWISEDEWQARTSIYSEDCEEIVWWLDGDGDGFGGGSGVLRCEAPAGHTQSYGDCDDSDPTSFPGGVELCDGRNNDCDASVDEDAPDSQLWFRDSDGDGFGTSRFSEFTCQQPEGYVARAQDCDDSEARVNPEALEVCDGLDNDCDDVIDVGALDAEAWFDDGDGDGYGDEESLAFGCEPPPGSVTGAGDCDDANSGINPDAEEICADGIDNDCDGGVGAGCATAGVHDLPLSGGLTTGHAGAQAGAAVAGVGDFDGDGLSDLLVGLPGSGVGDGAAALVSGLSGSLDEVITVFTGVDGALAGAAVAGASDLDRDGYGDFVIGGPEGAGYAWVIYGGEEPLPGEVDLADADAVIEGYGDRFGGSVSGTNYVDEDLFPELFVGASQYEDGAGAAFLFPGPVEGALDPEADAGAILVGPEADARAGHSVAGTGDVDGDGVGDLLVGAPGSQGDAGVAWVVFGPVSGTLNLADVGVPLSGEAGKGIVGNQVGPAGDTDNDGYADVMVSAPRVGFGEAYLFLGPVDAARVMSEADAILQTPTERVDQLTLSSLDFDGDGAWDVFLGDPGAGVDERGAIYGVYGPFSGVIPMDEADVRWEGASAYDRAGAALGRVGDADGDSFSELLVGAPGVAGERGGVWLLEVSGL